MRSNRIYIRRRSSFVHSALLRDQAMSTAWRAAVVHLKRPVAFLSFSFLFLPYSSRVCLPACACASMPSGLLFCAFAQPGSSPPCAFRVAGSLPCAHPVTSLTSPNYFTYFTKLLHLLHKFTSLTSPNYFTYFTKWLHLLHQIPSLTSPNYFTYFTT